MTFITFAAYARHRGVSREAVRQAVESGRIKAVFVNGKRGLYTEDADKQWAANTKSQAEAFVQTVAEGEEPGQSYNDARIEKEQIQAKLLQLKYDELSGKLVLA